MIHFEGMLCHCKAKNGKGGIVVASADTALFFPWIVKTTMSVLQQSCRAMKAPTGKLLQNSLRHPDKQNPTVGVSRCRGGLVVLSDRRD